MELYQINFVDGIPVYRQLVDRLRTNIKNGTLPNGSRLPTVRELSHQLSVAQGTVKRAYDELRSEGLVTQVQGSGTFVNYREISPESRKEQAMAAIDAMLDQLEELHFSMAETRIYIDLKLRERETVQEDLKIALVECNPEILYQTAAQLRQLPGIDLYTFVLDDVRRYPYALAEDMDLIITTMTHYDELAELIALPKKLSRIALRPAPRSIGQIVKLPEDTVVGILSASLRYGELIRHTCASYTDHITILEPRLIDDGKAVMDLTAQADAIIVPEGYEKYASDATKELLSAFSARNPLLFCAYQIDEGSFMYVEDKVKRLYDAKQI